MKVYINELSHITHTDSLTLNSLLHEVHLLSVKGIAIAVNGEVIAKSSWSDYTLQDNDKLIVIKATQGG